MKADIEKLLDKVIAKIERLEDKDEPTEKEENLLAILEDLRESLEQSVSDIEGLFW